MIFIFGGKWCGNIDYKQTILLQKSSVFLEAIRFSTTCGELAKITKGIIDKTLRLANAPAH